VLEQDRAVRDRRDEVMLRDYARTRDPLLRERLVERFLPLARSLAWRYGSTSEPIDDLIQVATEGLIKAIDRYDPERVNAFSSYATPVILGGLRHYFRDATQRVHIPRGLQERMLKVGAAIDALDAEVSVADVAMRTELTEAQVSEAMNALATRRPMSIESHMGTDPEEPGPTLAETISSNESGYDRVESSMAVAGVDLAPMERQALYLRYGHSLDQREIGERIGTSQMQVSRLLRRSLRKMLAAVQEEPAGTDRSSGR